MSQSMMARVPLGGPFRLLSKDEIDITPRTALRQAILAVLVCAPGQIKARSSIQEMFWGGVDPERAAGRLKTALSALKKDLSVLGNDTLRTDRTVVSLAPNRISTFKVDGVALEIFDGMDVPLPSADDFERWLQSFRNDGDEAVDRAYNPPVEFLEAKQSKISVGLLTPQSSRVTDADVLAADAFLNDVASILSHLSHVAIYDLRSDTMDRRALPVTNPHNVSVFLSATFRGEKGREELVLRLIKASTKEILWTSKEFDLNEEDQAFAASHAAEQILDCLVRISPTQRQTSLLPWAVMSGLFSLDPNTIVGTEEQLSLVSPDDEEGIVQPLQVFAQIFRENEGLAKHQEIDTDWLVKVSNQVSQSSRLQALSESLLGYSAHMLANNRELGSLLVEQSFLRAPYLILNLDHLTVVRLSKGDVAGAATTLQKLLKVSKLSPWRYSFEVTGAMVALARGDTKSSLAYANSALIRKPKFIGALRYAMVSCALAGNTKDAHRMKVRIRQLRPEYDFSIWLENVLRRSTPQFGRSIEDSFVQNDLI